MLNLKAGQVNRLEVGYYYSNNNPLFTVIKTYDYDIPWEKAMAPHSNTLAWKSHGWRSLEGCSPWGR